VLERAKNSLSHSRVRGIIRIFRVSPQQPPHPFCLRLDLRTPLIYDRSCILPTISRQRCPLRSSAASGPRASAHVGRGLGPAPRGCARARTSAASPPSPAPRSDSLHYPAVPPLRWPLSTRPGASHCSSWPRSRRRVDRATWISDGLAPGDVLPQRHPTPRPSPSPTLECLRGERRCNFASPLSSIGSLARWLPPPLEGIPSAHSSQREAKLQLLDSSLIMLEKMPTDGDKTTRTSKEELHRSTFQGRRYRSHVPSFKLAIHNIHRLP
jgi:hypothetical protein